MSKKKGWGLFQYFYSDKKDENEDVVKKDELENKKDDVVKKEDVVGEEADESWENESGEDESGEDESEEDESGEDESDEDECDECKEDECNDCDIPSKYDLNELITEYLDETTYNIQRKCDKCMMKNINAFEKKYDIVNKVKHMYYNMLDEPNSNKIVLLLFFLHALSISSEATLLIVSGFNCLL